MEALVAYDVNTSTPAGRRRLHAVARACEGYGQRVQYSVFELVCTASDYVTLMARLNSLLDPAVDSLRVYRLTQGTLASATVVGRQRGLFVDAAWII